MINMIYFYNQYYYYDRNANSFKFVWHFDEVNTKTDVKCSNNGAENEIRKWSDPLSGLC